MRPLPQKIPSWQGNECWSTFRIIANSTRPSTEPLGFANFHGPACFRGCLFHPCETPLLAGRSDRNQTDLPKREFQCSYRGLAYAQGLTSVSGVLPLCDFLGCWRSGAVPRINPCAVGPENRSD